MAFLVVRHKVEDYERWKARFDADAPNRKQSGSKGGYALRNSNDPNELMVILEWDDEHKLREFADSPDLQERMQAAGVIDYADIYIMHVADRPVV